MLTARTLAEAQIYVSLTTAADLEVPASEPAPLQPGENLLEGADGWTLRSTAGELLIPFDSENASRTVGARFGLGVSQLVDAAQWAVVAATFARRALEADMAYTGAPDQDRYRRRDSTGSLRRTRSARRSSSCLREPMRRRTRRCGRSSGGRPGRRTGTW